MVLVSAPPYFPDETRAIQRRFSAAVMSPVEMELMRQRHQHGEPQIEQLFAYARAMADTTDDVNFTPQRLSTITAETLIVFGDRDPLYPVSIAFELHAAIPRAYLWVVPNGGMGPCLESLRQRFPRPCCPFCEEIGQTFPRLCPYVGNRRLVWVAVRPGCKRRLGI